MILAIYLRFSEIYFVLYIENQKVGIAHPTKATVSDYCLQSSDRKIN